MRLDNGYSEQNWTKLRSILVDMRDNDPHLGTQDLSTDQRQYLKNTALLQVLFSLNSFPSRLVATFVQVEHSAILLTFMKLPIVIKIFVLSIFEWPFYTGFTALQYCTHLKCIGESFQYSTILNVG